MPDTTTHGQPMTSDYEPHASAPGALLRDRVLVIEDDMVNRRVAEEILKARGFSVESAADGEEGVARVAADEPGYGVILMDLHMPRLDGISAIRRIRALADPDRAAARIVMLTADSTEEARSGALAAGANVCLLKPFRADSLMAALRGADDEGKSVRDAAPPPVNAAVPGMPGDRPVLSHRQSGLSSLTIETLERVVALYRAAMPRHLGRLRDGLRERDAAAAVAEAHALRGTAAVVGAERLTDLAMQVEERARGGDFAAAEGLLPRLDAAGAATETALDALLRSRASG